MKVPTKQDLEIYQGEDFEFEFPPIWDSACDPVDLSLYTAEIEARLHPSDPEVAFTITDITLDVYGFITIEMEDTETELLEDPSYYYDVKLESPSGDISYPYAGIIFVVPNVTEP